jgi:hypothetical protein
MRSPSMECVTASSVDCAFTVCDRSSASCRRTLLAAVVRVLARKKSHSRSDRSSAHLVLQCSLTLLGLGQSPGGPVVSPQHGGNLSSGPGGGGQSGSLSTSLLGLLAGTPGETVGRSRDESHDEGVVFWGESMSLCRVG